jgi:hypothetical protein
VDFQCRNCMVNLGDVHPAHPLWSWLSHLNA